METGEQALLRILSSHLDVTEKLLEHYIKIAAAVRLQPDIAGRLPVDLFLRPPTLQELHATIGQLHQQVQTILHQK
jgi:hypothetical protein